MPGCAPLRTRIEHLDEDLTDALFDNLPDVSWDHVLLSHGACALAATLRVARLCTFTVHASAVHGRLSMPPPRYVVTLKFDVVEEPCNAQALLKQDVDRGEGYED